MSEIGKRHLFMKSRFQDWETTTRQKIEHQLQSEGRNLLNSDADGVKAVEMAKHYQFPMVILSSDKPQARVDSTTRSVEYIVKYEGDSAFFDFVPTTLSYNNPVAAVRHNELHLDFQYQDEPRDVKPEFEREYSNLRQWASWLQADGQKFNDGLQQDIVNAITARKEAIQREIDQEKELNS